MAATKKTLLFCYGITIILYSSFLLWGIFYPDNRTKLAGAILLLFAIMPAISFVAAMIIGIKNALWKWLYPVVVAFLGYIVNAAAIPTGSRMPGLFCVASSVIGLGIGLFIWKLRNRKRV